MEQQHDVDSALYGIAIDPCDLRRAVRDEHRPSRTVESFARETSAGPVGDISNWDDQAILAGMTVECAEIRALDSNYPGRYHRLGTYILESTNRFGADAVRQMLRAEGINRTTAHWAKGIARLYTYEQARRSKAICPERRQVVQETFANTSGSCGKRTTPFPSTPMSAVKETCCVSSLRRLRLAANR
ncbi:MAG TPA: hypothetical protein VMY42_23840 [Thermoguttaceae bacterium]|nr:hypothetical protein [Thermoguttaceae bacterium]